MIYDKGKAIFITVRTGSSRLPRKSLIPLTDLTTTEYLIQRLKLNKSSAQIILCTTDLDEDIVLTDLAKKNNIDYFQGSETDKLDRWLKASKKFDIDYIVTADGDDLFCEPELIDLAFSQFEKSDPDFIKCDGIVCGAFTYGIKVSSLKKVCDIKNTDDYKGL